MLTSNLSQDSGNDGREVEVSNLQQAKVVQWRNEYGESRIDSNDPREGQEIVEGRYEDGGLKQNAYRPHNCLCERASLISGAPLLYSNQALHFTLETESPDWTFGDWDLAIEIGLLRPDHLRDPAEASHDCIHSKCPLPFLGRGYECSYEWTEVRTQNDEAGPDIQLSRSFVDEEEVLDEHGTAALGDGGEESVENTEGHELGEERQQSAASKREIDMY